MKSEQEFIASLWSEIHTREWDFKQKQGMKQINRRLIFNELLLFGMLLILLAAGCFLLFGIKDNSEAVYFIAALLSTVAFLTEKRFYTKSQEVSMNENRNHY